MHGVAVLVADEQVFDFNLLELVRGILMLVRYAIGRASIPDFNIIFFHIERSD